jgi:hypothetical protein
MQEGRELWFRAPRQLAYYKKDIYTLPSFKPSKKKAES